MTTTTNKVEMVATVTVALPCEDVICTPCHVISSVCSLIPVHVGFQYYIPKAGNGSEDKATIL